MSEITWDKYSLKISEKRIFLLGGEFHYWRVPDKERWKDILKMYKIAGLNCVRIYFHWGYHNPKEGKYYFESNRDIKYLLDLCQELGLYVFVAQGPYICAETTAGGYPLWLLGRRDIRIKHLENTGKSVYDPYYMKYSKQWYENFIRLIKKYQITENPLSNIIAFQIENEYTEHETTLRIYMQELISYAEELGITVPTFHNDVEELGSWNDLIDLYGFDKYPIWADKTPENLPISNWRFVSFRKKIDRIEEKVRSFGGTAANSPLFIPELQGGWYNHWGIIYGYDTLYNFYGETYQKMLLQSLTAQGVTMMILYMFYGGTSWGSLPNPEVYTSYDYSASIREYGFQSSRLRHLRLFSLFIQSFKNSFFATDLVDPPKISCDQKNIFYRQRLANDGTNFYFFRNFNKDNNEEFNIMLSEKLQIPKENNQYLRSRDSFIAIGNHQIGDFHIKFCSLNIILKGTYADGHLIVLINNGGELLIDGTHFEISGKINSYVEGGFTRISFDSQESGLIANSSGGKLYILCLSEETALTLNADFNESDIRLGWGAYSLFFSKNGDIETEILESQTVWILDSSNTAEGFEKVEDSIIPGLMKRIYSSKIELPELSFGTWYKLKTNWANQDNSNIWKEIDFEIDKNPIDHNYMCGHVLYKCEFHTSNFQNLTVKINSRHKTAIWLNNQFIGGHNTYSINSMQPGAMMGIDPPDKGGEIYDLTKFIKSDKNILFILTENLGQNKNFFVADDLRNPRGILAVEFSTLLTSESWYISGIDVTKIKQSYNTSGLPGEKFGFQLGEGKEWKEINHQPTVTPNDQIIWYKTIFNWKINEKIRIPLRLHIEGKHNVHIFLNGLYIGNYWGAYGPQHDFYIMDNLLKKENVLVLACWTTEKDNLKLSIKPYKIKTDSGNIDEEGIVFATQKHIIKLD
ncbi:MAG: beta-galactosidase [Candidatus Hermodarchaeota archaeon]